MQLARRPAVIIRVLLALETHTRHPDELFHQPTHRHPTALTPSPFLLLSHPPPWPQLFTFLPINLFEQFTRIANLYFLIIAILQLIPGLAPTSWFTTVCPLVIVLLINAIKEIADDYYRHRWGQSLWRSPGARSLARVQGVAPWPVMVARAGLQNVMLRHCWHKGHAACAGMLVARA